MSRMLDTIQAHERSRFQSTETNAQVVDVLRQVIVDANARISALESELKAIKAIIQQAEHKRHSNESKPAVSSILVSKQQQAFTDSHAPTVAPSTSIYSEQNTVIQTPARTRTRVGQNVFGSIASAAHTTSLSSVGQTPGASAKGGFDWTLGEGASSSNDINMSTASDSARPSSTLHSQPRWRSEFGTSTGLSRSWSVPESRADDFFGRPSSLSHLSLTNTPLNGSQSASSAFTSTLTNRNTSLNVAVGSRGMLSQYEGFTGLVEQSMQNPPMGPQPVNQSVNSKEQFVRPPISDQVPDSEFHEYVFHPNLGFRVRFCSTPSWFLPVTTEEYSEPGPLTITFTQRILRAEHLQYVPNENRDSAQIFADTAHWWILVYDRSGLVLEHPYTPDTVDVGEIVRVPGDPSSLLDGGEEVHFKGPCRLVAGLVTYDGCDTCTHMGAPYEPCLVWRLRVCGGLGRGFATSFWRDVGMADCVGYWRAGEIEEALFGCEKDESERANAAEQARNMFLIVLEKARQLNAKKAMMVSKASVVASGKASSDVVMGEVREADAPGASSEVGSDAMVVEPPIQAIDPSSCGTERQDDVITDTFIEPGVPASSQVEPRSLSSINARARVGLLTPADEHTQPVEVAAGIFQDSSAANVASASTTYANAVQLAASVMPLDAKVVDSPIDRATDVPTSNETHNSHAPKNFNEPSPVELCANHVGEVDLDERTAMEARDNSPLQSGAVAHEEESGTPLVRYNSNTSTTSSEFFCGSQETAIGDVLDSAEFAPVEGKGGMKGHGPDGTSGPSKNDSDKDGGHDAGCSATGTDFLAMYEDEDVVIGGSHEHDDEITGNTTPRSKSAASRASTFPALTVLDGPTHDGQTAMKQSVFLAPRKEIAGTPSNAPALIAGINFGEDVDVDLAEVAPAAESDGIEATVSHMTLSHTVNVPPSPTPVSVGSNSQGVWSGSINQPTTCDDAIHTYAGQSCARCVSKTKKCDRRLPKCTLCAGRKKNLDCIYPAPNAEVMNIDPDAAVTLGSGETTQMHVEDLPRTPTRAVKNDVPSHIADTTANASGAKPSRTTRKSGRISPKEEAVTSSALGKKRRQHLDENPQKTHTQKKKAKKAAVEYDKENSSQKLIVTSDGE
ncbi:hypothetical protein BC830DRAFT_1163115 [Chytriomyces sp. MP71]|nr:hypothetical protein BC830DRAFT_1163115 [Chytriomyces sp. MP71]